MPILMKNVRLQGILVGSRTMFEAMTKAIAVNQMHPIIDRIFEFDDAIAALKYMESGAAFRQGGDTGVRSWGMQKIHYDAEPST